VCFGSEEVVVLAFATGEQALTAPSTSRVGMILGGLCHFVARESVGIALAEMRTEGFEC
jgi:hypothetical protein